MNLQRKGNGSTNIIISKYGIKCQIKQSKQFQPTLLYEDKYEITCWYLIRPPLLSSEEICRVYLKQSKYVRTKSLLVLVYIYIFVLLGFCSWSHYLYVSAIGDALFCLWHLEDYIC